MVGSGDFVAAWQAWHRGRLERVNAEDGPPTLARTIWLDEADAVPGAPGRWRADGDGVTVELDGERRELAIGSRTRFEAVTTQVVSREGRIGVRVFEHARAGAVAGIDAFEPSPEWVVRGTFEPLPPGTVAGYGYALESAPRETEVAGVLRFELEGQQYELQPLDDDGALFLVFADATTGKRTKAPGRFLRVEGPEGGAGEVTIDFNRAYLPPCAFSDEFNCPLPPPGHRLAVEVTAGEAWARPATAPAPAAAPALE